MIIEWYRTLGGEQRAFIGGSLLFVSVGMMFTLFPISGIIVISIWSIGCVILTLLFLKDSLLKRVVTAIASACLLSMVGYYFLTNIKVGWGITIVLILFMWFISRNSTQVEVSDGEETTEKT